MRFYKLSLPYRFRQAALWGLLSAFAFRALIPIGYMPDFGSIAGGALKVVICTGAGSKTIVLDAAGTPIPSRHTLKVDHPCVFTGMTAVVSAADFGFIEQQYTSHRFASSVADQHFPRKSGFVLGPRGPPAV